MTLSSSFYKRLTILLLLAPALIILLGFFLIPMLMMFFISLEDPNQQLTWGNYLNFFQDAYYWKVLWKSIKISGYTALVTLLLAYPVALFMSQASGRVKGLVTFIVLIPHLVSVVIRNFGWTILLNKQGVVNSLLLQLGIIKEPLTLMYNEIGVVIGLVDYVIAFMVLAIATSLYGIDPSLQKAAAILGANRWRTFISVTFPLSLPGVFSGVVLVFSLAMSSYVTPALMGGSAVKLLTSQIYQEIMVTINWPMGAALSFVLLACTFLIVSLFSKIVETRRYKEGVQ